MIRCTKCGCLNEERERVCHECGFALTYGPCQTKSLGLANGSGIVIQMHASADTSTDTNAETSRSDESVAETAQAYSPRLNSLHAKSSTESDNSDISNVSQVSESPNASDADSSALSNSDDESEVPSSDSADAPRGFSGHGMADICHAIVFALVTPIAYLIGESALMLCAAAGMVLALLAHTARKQGMDVPALFMHRAGQILCWWCIGVCVLSLVMQYVLGCGLFIQVPIYHEALPTAFPSFSAWLR